MVAATNLLFRESCEPALNEVEPGSTDRGEMQVEARMVLQPASNRRRLVGSVVVEDHVDVEVLRLGRVDGLQELTELEGAMAFLAFPDDLPCPGIQGGKERERPVTLVVVGSALRLARAKWQQRLGADQSLDLRLLVHTQHQGAVRRIQIQTDDVTDLLSTNFEKWSKVNNEKWTTPGVRRGNCPKE